MSIGKDSIRQLHGWTHDCLDLLDLCVAALPGELYTREIAGFGRGGVRDQMVHICRAEATWVCALQNRPRPDLRPELFPDAGSVAALREQVMTATRRYLDELPEEILDTELDHYPDYWAGPRRTPAFIMMHVLTHAFHHKGQIVAMLRILGHPAPDTDLQRV
jgi:uncharacterized damage-inducible protein DinB